MRKNKNANPVSRGTDNSLKNITIGTVTLTVKTVIEEHEKKHAKVEWDFGVATPLVNLLTSNKLSRDEVRMSVAKFKVHVNGQLKERNISEYGLSNAHIPLLKGITYKPERRSGMMKNMGSLALAILLFHETKLTNKLEAALLESIKMVPSAQAVVEALKRAKDMREIRAFMKSFGDYLLLVGDRSQGKIHIPLMLWYRGWSNIADRQFFNFSGANGMMWYNRQVENLHYQRMTDGTMEEMRQVEFHATFETATEDLGLLKEITNERAWKTRPAISNVFSKKNGTKQKCQPLTFSYISRAAAANMTKLTATLQPMLINRICFAGKRKRHFSQDFKAYLETGSQTIAHSTDINGLSYMFQNRKAELMKELGTTKATGAGTTVWKKVNGKEMVDNAAFEPMETGQYFYI